MYDIRYDFEYQILQKECQSISISISRILIYIASMFLAVCISYIQALSATI